MWVGHRWHYDTRSMPLKEDDRKPKWTEEEVQFVKHHYPLLPASALAEKLNRSEESIRQKGRTLGIRKKRLIYPQKHWTDEEKQLLSKLYPITPAKDLVSIFHRTKNAIRKVAREYNIEKEEVVYNFTEFEKGQLSMAIDTDGSLGFYKYKSKNNKSGFTWRPCFQFTNTKRKIVEYIKSLIGSGTISIVHREAPAKDAFHYCINHSRHLLPFLKELKLIIKERQRLLLIEACELFQKHRAGHTPHNEHLLHICEKMKVLNKRGVVERINE